MFPAALPQAKLLRTVGAQIHLFVHVVLCEFVPWIVEVTPRFALGSADDPTGVDPITALALVIERIEGVDEVMQPGGEVARVSALMRLLQGGGVLFGILIGLVVVVVVSNAVKITVFQRRDEIAIMKLVGATDGFVRVPLLLSGLVQGALGALVGLLALGLLHASLARIVSVALSASAGVFVLDPLPVSLWLLFLASGAVLGVVGALLSVGRFLRV